jgi:hypothetical protein
MFARLSLFLLLLSIFCGCAALPDPTTGEYTRIPLPGGVVVPEDNAAVLRCVQVEAGTRDLYLSARITDDLALRLEGRQEAAVPAGKHRLKVWQRQRPFSTTQAVGSGYVTRKVVAGVFCLGEAELTMKPGRIYIVYLSRDMRDTGWEGGLLVRILQSSNGVDFDVLSEKNLLPGGR